MYLNTISWQTAVTLLFKEKVHVVATYDKVISNVTKTFEIQVPKVIRLVKMVDRIYKNKVPFSKHGVFIRDRNTCGYCSTVMETRDCTVDHIVPVSKGGKSEWSNAVCSCKTCNHRKADKDLRESGLRLHITPTTPTISSFVSLKMRSLGIEEYINDLLTNLC